MRKFIGVMMLIALATILFSWMKGGAFETHAKLSAADGLLVGILYAGSIGAFLLAAYNAASLAHRGWGWIWINILTPIWFIGVAALTASVPFPITLSKEGPWEAVSGSVLITFMVLCLLDVLFHSQEKRLA